jgi:hypothetical protein
MARFHIGGLDSVGYSIEEAVRAADLYVEAMRVVNPGAKGKAGENEACEWLMKHIYDNKRILHRNRNQTFVGADIVTKPFVIEVKRRETLALDKWWIQINKVRNRMREYDQEWIPVVMFRVNRGPWEFLISAEVIGDTTGWIRIPQNRFIRWARRYVIE